MDASARTQSPREDGAWLAELRATMALAWPLILANLTQQAIQATDVLLMGRLGPTQLAAATLALNLTFWSCRNSIRQCTYMSIVALTTQPPWLSLYEAMSVPPPANPSRSGARDCTLV